MYLLEKSDSNHGLKTLHIAANIILFMKLSVHSIHSYTSKFRFNITSSFKLAFWFKVVELKDMSKNQVLMEIKSWITWFKFRFKYLDWNKPPQYN